MRYIFFLILSILLVTSCSMTSKLEKKQPRVRVSLPSLSDDNPKTELEKFDRPSVLEFKNLKGEKTIYATAEYDSSGKKRISVELQGVTVVAKSKLVPERNGKILLNFIIRVPRELLSRKWVLDIIPSINSELGEKYFLHDIVISGNDFKKYQLKGENRLSLMRSRFSIFERDIMNVRNYYNKKYNLLVQYPHAKLDTIIKQSSHFEYYYSQEVNAVDNSKRLSLALKGQVFAIDRSKYSLPLSDSVTYLVSSMINFLDTTTHYKMKIVNRKAKSSLKAFIGFAPNEVAMQEEFGDNHHELEKINNTIIKLSSNKEFVIDSISLSAAASPEGASESNFKLSMLRVNQIKSYFEKQLTMVDGIDTLLRPHAKGEDWNAFFKLVAGAENLYHKNEILSLIRENKNVDSKEMTIARLFPNDYNILKQTIYPKLRMVDFDFYMHRKGMEKDTIHTKEVDSLYMSALDLIKNHRDYSKALVILNEYSDWNTGICLMSLGYNEGAYKIFLSQKESADTEYLLSILAARLGNDREAYEHYSHSVELDPTKKWRGSLDPEINRLVDKYKTVR